MENEGGFVCLEGVIVIYCKHNVNEYNLCWKCHIHLLRVRNYKVKKQRRRLKYVVEKEKREKKANIAKRRLFNRNKRQKALDKS